MSITTLAGLAAGKLPERFITKGAITAINGVNCRTLWGVTGYPIAGTWDNTLNGVALSAPVTGAIPFDNPASGNTYINRLVGGGVNPQTILVCDRLWHNGGITITSTSVQNVTSPTFPARDIDGSSNGNGVLLCVELSATCGAAAPTITISYTNEAGVAGRTANNILATANNLAANQCMWMSLQEADRGVKSVESITLSTSWISGTINIVAFRPLGALCLPYGSKEFASDPLLMPNAKVPDSAVLYLQGITYGGSSGTSFCGNLSLSQG